MDLLIAGASGLVGGALLRLALADVRVRKVVAAGRRPLPIEDAKLEQRVAELDALPDLPPADAAVSCLGTTIAKAGSQDAFRRVDHDLVLAFAEAGRRAGARRFLVVTAVGADPRSRIFYNRVKGETERDLAALGFESLVLARPSLLLGHRAEHRAGEAIAVRLAPLFRPLMIGPLRRVRPIEAEKVARALLERALDAPPGTTVLTNEEMLAYA